MTRLSRALVPLDRLSFVDGNVIAIIVANTKIVLRFHMSGHTAAARLNQFNASALSTATPEPLA